MKKITQFSLCFASFLSLTPCFAQTAEVAQNPFQETLSGVNTYDALYPLYVVECAGTQVKKKNGTPGGPFGHVLVYLKDVCRDTTVDYPKVRKCAPGEKDLSTPNGGMALSLDQKYINTRFIATDGLDLVLNGNLNEQGTLDQAEMNKVTEAIIASGATRGIKISDAAAKAKPANMSLDEYIASSALSTGTALRFGRNIRCVSIPINEAMLDSAINWVNTQNDPLVTGKEEYHWGLFDECVHFSHNVIAAMGIGDHVNPTEKPLVEAAEFSSIIWRPWSPMFHVPMNDIISTEENAGEAKIPSALVLYNNKKELAKFNQFGRFAATDGAIIWSANAHANNEVYDTHATPLFLELPILQPREKKMEHALASPSATMLSDNLAAYRTRLEDVMNNQPSYDELLHAHGDLNTPEFKEFYLRYASILKQMDMDLIARQARLSPRE